jgi:hypothetical protein
MQSHVYAGTVLDGGLRTSTAFSNPARRADRHETAERIRRAIAINLVIAWRIMLMTLLGRETPLLPPDVMFSNIELQVLNAYAKNKRLPSQNSPGLATSACATLGM